MEDSHWWSLSHHHGPLVCSLWVLDFVMSPPSRFCFLEHLLKCQTQLFFFFISTCLILSCLLGFLLSVAFKSSSFLGWEDTEIEGTLLSSWPACLFGALKRQQLRAQPRALGEGCLNLTTPACEQGLTCTFLSLRTEVSRRVRRPALGL